MISIDALKTFCFVGVGLFISLWLELAVSSAGIILPLFMVQIFYITVLKKWKWGLVSAFLLCHTLDSLTGYVSLPSMFVVVILASFWRGLGDCSRLELQVIPLLLCLFLSVSLLLILTHFKQGGLISWGSSIFDFSIAVVGGAFLSPLIIGLQDRLAKALKIPTYTDIQHEELYSASTS